MKTQWPSLNSNWNSMQNQAFPSPFIQNERNLKSRFRLCWKPAHLCKVRTIIFPGSHSITFHPSQSPVLESSTTSVIPCGPRAVNQLLVWEFEELSSLVKEEEKRNWNETKPSCVYDTVSAVLTTVHGWSCTWQSLNAVSYTLNVSVVCSTNFALSLCRGKIVRLVF